jgi:hypothetical protein
MKQGYIKLFRKFSETSFYKDAHAVQLAIHLLLKANHAEQKMIFDDEEITIKRGQTVTGRFTLSGETGMNPSMVYRKLQTLKKVCFLDIKANNRYSLITIIKYGQYQDGSNKSNSESNNWRTTGEQLANTNKNDKKVKNEKKKTLKATFQVFNPNEEENKQIINRLIGVIAKDKKI